MPKGTIIWIGDQGYGFITTEQGEDLFFHRNELQGVAYDSLREGQEVEFEVKQRSGHPKTIQMRLAQAKGE
jgi:CspA family cold shock protein